MLGDADAARHELQAACAALIQLGANTAAASSQRELTELA